MPEPIALTDITAARERGRRVVLETPALPSSSFSRLIGSDVWLKAENLQRTGSFKIRGGMNAISLLSKEARASGVVAASAGNHAQGVALAASRMGARATIVMPRTTPAIKVQACLLYTSDAADDRPRG